MKRLTECPVCSSGQLKPAFSAPTTRGQDSAIWHVDECGSCSHQMMNPQPSWDELSPYYNEGYDPYDPNHGSDAGDHDVIRAARKSGIFRHLPLPTGKRVLDVGCGAGFFIRVAGKLGGICQGVEPSTHAANVARKQNLNVFCGTLEAFVDQTSDKFDVITANHVIEHVPDPVKTLSAMKRLLAPEGLIWIAVPNAAYPVSRVLRGKWHSTDLPYHLMQFSPQSMAKAAHEAGLKVRNLYTESVPAMVEGSLGQYLRHRWKLPRRLAQETGLLKFPAKWYARRVDEQVNGEAIIVEMG